MVKFTKLRIVGFKSFVEPMEFVIGEGLTGVVGPNGCGKSNLTESLRWVMGENSYKNMRASGMDDVIFSGSLNRPARNTAEVTLFLDNTDRMAPTGFNDADVLEVSRRIERESGSTYRINSKEVRARDVQLLFADASTGARSPSMVRQGQIGELISAKPTSRRRILEEAAGISGLHTRRHDAEIRLRAAEQNLERLEDVLVQIDSQLDSLKRQSRQATRYRNLSSEIRAAEAGIFYLRWTDARDVLATAEEQFTEAQKNVSVAATAQADVAKKQAISAHELPKLRDEAARAGAVLQRLVIARNDLDSEDRRIRERLQDLERRLVQLAEDITREEQMVAENDEVLERLQEERAELLEENEHMAERAMAASEKVETAEGRVSELEEVLGEKTRQQAEVVALRQQLERALSDIRQRTARLVAQAEEASAALQALKSEIAETEGLAPFMEQVELAEAELMAAEEASEAAENATREAREAEVAARSPLAEAERVFSQHETEARTLEQVLNVGGMGEWPPVVDALQVTPGLETALGAALGEDLDASVDPEAPVHWGDAGDRSGDPGLPQGVEPLASYASGPDVLARRLAQIGLVSDPDEGARLQKSLLPGQRLVSREGHLWRWDGYVVAADAPTPAAQRLAQKNRLTELSELIELAREEVEERRSVLARAQEAVSTASEAEKAARQQVRDRQSGLSAARTALAAAEREQSQLAARLASAEEREERFTEEAAVAREALAEAEEQLDQAPEAEGFAEEISRLQQEVSSARSVLAEARALSEGLTREKQMRDRRLEAIAREYENWRSRAANAAQQIGILRERRQEAEDERAELMEAPEDIEMKRRALISEIDKAETARKQADDALTSAEMAQVEVDRLAKDALEALSQTREGRIRAEERVEAARQRLKEIESRIADDLDAAVNELPQLAGFREGAPLPDAGGLETRLERLKTERERLGGVNLRAEEELRDVDEQRNTLASERDDLIEAIKRLRTGISNLNREARERLLAAFDVVNGHFQELFTHLFGGGTAELQLVDAEDPLDAGLEIIARPPGKKPQTMTLLSGGEQALTAMALIFAVFLTNPSPICVLDEVDAPLDDANVERYCDLLEEMSNRTETRFIVITHNPITMARMRRLFGVTMAERGVSQLVSVDLETAESFAEVG